MKRTLCGLIICLMLASATAPGLKTSASSFPVTILWQQDLSGYVKIANLTGSRLPDVIVGAGGTIYAFDGRGKALWNLTGLQEVSTLEVGDANNDGLDDVLALTGAGFSRDLTVMVRLTQLFVLSTRQVLFCGNVFSAACIREEGSRSLQ